MDLINSKKKSYTLTYKQLVTYTYTELNLEK